MPISDFHSDILTAKEFTRLPQFYYENNVITAVFKGKRTFKEAIGLAEKGRLIAFEDVGYDDFDFDALKLTNPQYVGLTWNGENRFGYGCDFDLGLKAEGIDLIEKLNKANIAVDTAHISTGGFKDIIEKAKRVVNSHTCFNGVYRHKRNLDDWQLDLLIKRNALVGVTFCGYFMTDEKVCKISDLTRQIDYFAQRYGIDNLCIGTDYFGCDFLPENLNNYSSFYYLKDALEKLGYQDRDIQKLFYSNLNDFLENNSNEQ